MYSLVFTFLQISAVFSFHLRSAVIIIPSSVILSTDLTKLPFKSRFYDPQFLLEKLKVIILHLASFITILSFLVSETSMFRTS